MIYRTLHWYIMRELLRVFLMTAGALTTLLAFGGTFKPLTKEGLEITQLMWVLFNLMPAMLAYAIPLAALFAAVVVYWRLSTDNEITACRAGGVSFWAVLFPALLLGLVVASADLVFVNYVVPVFLQRTEETARQDLGAVLVHKIARQEPFEWGKYVIYADKGYQEVASPAQTPPGVDKRTVVMLSGVAVMELDKTGKPTASIIAREGNGFIDEIRQKDEIHATMQLIDGAGYDQKTFRQFRGTMRSIPPDGSAYVIPSLLKDRPKYLNYIQLRGLEQDPTLYGPVDDAQDAIVRELQRQKLASQYWEQWKHDQSLRFDQADNEYVVIHSPQAMLGVEGELMFASDDKTPVRVEQYRAGRLVYYYKADSGVLTLSDQSFVTEGNPPSVVGGIRLAGTVLLDDVSRGIPESRVEKEVLIEPLAIAGIIDGLKSQNISLDELQARRAQFTPDVQNMVTDLHDKINELGRDIGSELHSRGSFALSCLTLVLLGGALGIMMRGRNPLMVFVVGFVPAILLVLLITAGRRMVENSSGSLSPGYAVIWAGNVLLLVLVVSVYAKLLRQ